ncbi:MAG: imidazole glycerol phosphate synthase subunit HisH [Varibaculum sp.]|nr:imidazole glycerol phosphate synthase subunit HisH [Varibaculum sp.]
MTAKKHVVVLDFGSGNVRSALRAIGRVGAEAELTGDLHTAAEADGLVVPGVGAFDTVMGLLRQSRADTVIERRIAGSRPVLGICVGLQIMFDRGLEGHEDDEGSPGLAQWPGAVRRLQASILPHMGWSQVSAAPGSRLLAGLDGERFYFVHSFAATADPARLMDGHAQMVPPLVSWAKYGERFVAAIEDGALSATQFHPEKSGDVGAELLRNWIRSV